jgi:hypothetical protein
MLGVGVKCIIKIFVVVVDSSLWPTILPAGQDKRVHLCVWIFTAQIVIV